MRCHLTLLFTLFCVIGLRYSIDAQATTASAKSSVLEHLDTLKKSFNKRFTSPTSLFRSLSALEISNLRRLRLQQLLHSLGQLRTNLNEARNGLSNSAYSTYSTRSSPFVDPRKILSVGNAMTATASNIQNNSLGLMARKMKTTMTNKQDPLGLKLNLDMGVINKRMGRLFSQLTSRLKSTHEMQTRLANAHIMQRQNIQKRISPDIPSNNVIAGGFPNLNMIKSRASTMNSDNNNNQLNANNINTIRSRYSRNDGKRSLSKMLTQMLKDKFMALESTLFSKLEDTYRERTNSYQRRKAHLVPMKNDTSNGRVVYIFNK